MNAASLPAMRFARLPLLMLALAAPMAARADDQLATMQQVEAKAEEARKNDDLPAERQAYREALDALEAAHPGASAPDFWLPAHFYLRLAKVDEKTGLMDQAEADYAKAVADARSARATSLLVVAADKLEAIQFAHGQCREAIELAHSALAMLDADDKFGAIRLPSELTLAKCHAKEGARDLALKEFDATWKAGEKAQNVDPAVVDDLLHSSSDFYRSTHQEQLIPAREAQASRMRAPQIVPPPTATKPASGNIMRVVPVGTTAAGFANPSGFDSCKPAYPEEARLRNEQGRGRVQIVVEKDGSFQSAAIIQSSGSAALDRATVQALAKCYFKPAANNGQPVKGSFDAAYDWRLQ